LISLCISGAHPRKDEECRARAWLMCCEPPSLGHTEQFRQGIPWQPVIRGSFPNLPMGCCLQQLSWCMLVCACCCYTARSTVSYLPKAYAALRLLWHSWLPPSLQWHTSKRFGVLFPNSTHLFQRWQMGNPLPIPTGLPSKSHKACAQTECFRAWRP